ncbi:hypothetical protein JCM3775_000638 [Rhodotorula graminis]
MASTAPPLSPPPAVFTLDAPAGVGVLRTKAIAGRVFTPYALSDWAEWLACNARSERVGTAAEVPATVRAALAQPADPALLDVEPTYCNSYLGRAATPEEQLEFFARNGFLPAPPSPNEKERLKLVRAHNLDDLHMRDSVTDICELARAFFPEDVTAAAFAVTEQLSLIMGLSRAADDNAEWERIMSEMDPSWCLGRHTLAHEDGLFVVLDAEQDSRYKNSPMFQPGSIRFFAAVAISLPTASTSKDSPPAMVPVGILSCMSKSAHAEVTDAQVSALRTLAKRVERDLALAQKMEQQRRAREQASFISSFLRLTLGGTAAPSEMASASMQAVFGGTGTSSRRDTAAFDLAAERLCALSSASSVAILDLRNFLPARNGVGSNDELQRQAQRPRVHVRSPASGDIDYDASSHPLVVLGHSGLSPESIRRISSLRKGDIDEFEALVRRIKADEADAVQIQGDTVLGHLVPPNARASHLVPIHDHAKSLALLIVVSLDEHVDELTEVDRTFFANVGYASLSALVKDQDVESDRARLAFVSSISHALRLPLHGLAGQLELIRGASTGIDEHLAVADVCMDSLRGLLDDAVDFYHLADPMAMKPAPAAACELLDLSALVQDVTTHALNRSLQDAFDGDEDVPGMPKRDVAVVVDVAARAGGWLARARAGDLRRILANVVANAYRYTTKGEVRVTLEATGDVVSDQHVVKISVADTGCGIDEAFLRSGQLFMPFRRADAFTPSVGLGLPLVNLLVAQYGGSINVTSALNEGTTIEITLPLTLVESAPAPALERSLSEEIAVVIKAASSAARHGPTDAPAALIQLDPTSTPTRRPPFTRATTSASHEAPLSCPSSPSSRPELSRTNSSGSSQAYSSTSSILSRHRRPLRVLGCEDNLIARKLLAALVKKKGYEFHGAVDGQQGVDAFEQHRPDVTIMDIGMPVLDGIQASSMIRKIEIERGWPRSKIIALTGLSNKVDRVASQDIIDDWLLKGGDSLRVLTEQLARLQLELDDRDDDEPDTPISALASSTYKLDGVPPAPFQPAPPLLPLAGARLVLS